jgi:DNA-binding transcriptional LysR family regulator
LTGPKYMDIDTLETFVAAVEEKSLSRAAERQNVVVSAASKRITTLERRLNRKLLLRHGRGVEPTSAGKLLYLRAKSILSNIECTEMAVSHFSADGQAKIRLAANPSTILQFLPRRITRFLADRPHVSIDLLEAHSYDIPRMVIEGATGLGIYHARYPAMGVSSFPFCTDRVALVVPVGHPLAQRSAIRLEDALDYDILGYFPQHSLDKFLAYIGPSLSRPPNVKLQVSNFEARCVMIREGLGVGVLPEGIAQRYLAPLGLAMVKLEDDWAQRQFFICVKDHGDRSEAMQELLDFLLASRND